ncbi:hypothetical protein ABH990_001895 [Bradyrhizobium ottawaense]
MTPADRVHRGLQHHAVLRRADVDAAKLVFGGNLALDQLADLVVGLAQILGDLAHHVLVDLDDLELGLRDLALGLGARSDVLRAFAVETGRVAFELGQTRDLHQTLVVKLAHAGELVLHQRDLLILGLLLGAEPRDLLVELRDALAQLGLLSGAAVDADVEQLGFGGEQQLDVGIPSALDQGLRKFDPVDPALLGLQARRTRLRGVEILGDDGKVGLGDGIVEPHHDIAGLDQVAVAGAHLADHAAGRMLHLLDVGFDHDLARRDQRARDQHGRGPAAETDDKHQHDHEAEDQVKLDGFAYGLVRGRLRAADGHRAHGFVLMVWPLHLR